MAEQSAQSDLKDRLRGDLTAAMKSRDTVTTGTLRMALTAITNAEVAGESVRVLDDADVMAVLSKEVRKRQEAAQIYRDAGRDELAANEQAESAVLERYLPAPLSDEEISSRVDEVIAALTAANGAAPTMRQMGQVIKAVQADSGGRADGARIAAAVKSALA